MALIHAPVCPGLDVSPCAPSPGSSCCGCCSSDHAGLDPPARNRLQSGRLGLLAGRWILGADPGLRLCTTPPRLIPPVRADCSSPAPLFRLRQPDCRHAGWGDVISLGAQPCRYWLCPSRQTRESSARPASPWRGALRTPSQSGSLQKRSLQGATSRCAVAGSAAATSAPEPIRPGHRSTGRMLRTPLTPRRIALGGASRGDDAGTAAGKAMKITPWPV